MKASNHKMTGAAKQAPARSVRLTNRVLGVAMRGLIRLYQLCLSPLMPPSCRYQPTCSAYALEAIERHGPFKGTWLALKRIARCHPVTWLGGSSGYDPVPGPHNTACHHGHRTDAVHRPVQYFKQD